MTGQVWKLDFTFWLSDVRHDHEAYAERILERLTDETRPVILWLKDVWHRLPSYPEVVGGHEVYDAVLNHGVRSVEAFEAYLLERALG